MAKSRMTDRQARTMAAAVTVFTEGFTFTRSFTHPYRTERVGPLWIMRDAPRKKVADYRREEWVTTGLDPAEVDRIVRQHGRGRFALCVLVGPGENEAEVRATYKALGYRLFGTEAFMVHNLKKIPRATAKAVIGRVLTPKLADAVTKAAGWRQILPEHLHAKAPLRQYAAQRDGKVVGWVRSVVCAAGTWCADMRVQPPHRRQGIASALLAAMLRDDRKYGAKQAVLLASHAGAKLYAAMGYRLIGTLFLFQPKK